MFSGTFYPKLDEKGRFFLPAKFRDRLREGLVITRGHERALTIWELERFHEEIAGTVTGTSADEGVREYQRMMASSASDEVPDKQGRVRIPQPLREYARLRKEIVVIGAYTRLEVWDATHWEEYRAVAEERFSSMGRKPASTG